MAEQLPKQTLNTTRPPRPMGEFFWGRKAAEKETENFKDRYLDHTGVYNRRALGDLLPDLLQAFGDKTAFEVVDLKGLGKLNRRYGHDVGDVAIYSLVQALEQTAPGSVVIRLGGDEFLRIYDASEPDVVHGKGLEEAMRMRATETVGDGGGRLSRRLGKLSLHAGSSSADTEEIRQDPLRVWGHIKAADPKGPRSSILRGRGR